MKFFFHIFFIFVGGILAAQRGYEDALAIADSMPKFPGGTTELGKFIGRNMIIPVPVREGSKSEKAYVKFIIDTSGHVLDPVVVKPSNYKSFDAEAVRIVSIMPSWSPATDKGKKVKVFMTLPISYKNLGTVEAPPQTEEHKEAMKFWNEGHKLEQDRKYQEALEKYNKSLNVEPQNKYAMFDKAKMHMAVGETEKGCEIWNKMIQINVRKDEAEEFVKKFCLAENSKVEIAKYFNGKKASDFFTDGMDAVRSGRYSAALGKFDSCLKYNPVHEDALFNKAQMHLKLDQKKAACSSWNKLLGIKPDDAEVAELIKKHCN